MTPADGYLVSEKSEKEGLDKQRPVTEARLIQAKEGIERRM
jgi:hypothetical protein